MINRIILLVSLIAAIIVMVMLNLTTPAEVGPLGVLVFFVMCYLVLLGVMTGGMGLFFKVSGRKSGMRRKDYAYAAMVAFAPLMVLLVQAFSGLSLWTMGLIAAFVGLGCFVISRRV